MLSYKHAFHAGNFADVIKHLCWLDIIDYLGKKPKPFTLYDTHSGAGLYSLNDSSAAKNREYESGIGAIREATFTDPLVTRYLSICQQYLANHNYPGSPLIALTALDRNEDVELMELHPNEHTLLRRNTAAWSAAHVHHRDGYEGLIALTPPPNKRGAVLIDPPYEKATEYHQVVETVKKLLARWKKAQVVVWYPKLSRRAGDKYGAAERMVKKLAGLADAAFMAEVCVAPDTEEVGMYGTGVVVLNPPWQCDVRLSKAMEDVLAQLPGAPTFTCDWLTHPD